MPNETSHLRAQWPDAKSQREAVHLEGEWQALLRWLDGRNVLQWDDECPYPVAPELGGEG